MDNLERFWQKATARAADFVRAGIITIGSRIAP